MKDETIIERNVKATVKIKLVCGLCKKPHKDFDHYSVFNSETINTFVIYPCECTKSVKKEVDKVNF